MKQFKPSAAFLQYYQAVLAIANGPIAAGMGPVTIPLPDLHDIRERAFANTKLVPLITAINTYRASMVPEAPYYTPYEAPQGGP
jgi:hypothetical protein